MWQGEIGLTSYQAINSYIMSDMPLISNVVGESTLDLVIFTKNVKTLHRIGVLQI